MKYEFDFLLMRTSRIFCIATSTGGRKGQPASKTLSLYAVYQKFPDAGEKDGDPK
jgi:hypothetical protein